MAQLRLIALTALAACRASEAGPTSGLTPPAGWQALPELAKAAADAAKQSKITVEGVEAWGEPARGCYGAWIAWQGPRGAPDKAADQLIASVTEEPALAGIAVRDLVKPAPGAHAGVLSLAFDKVPYRGKLRAVVTRDGHVAALACFWNEREPIACDAACTPFVGSLK